MRDFIAVSLLLATIWSTGDVSAQTPPSQVCYGYLGCFSMAAPWYSPTRPLPAPQSPAVVATQFVIYTRAQPTAYFATKEPNISLSGSNYDGSKPTFFLIHGFSATGFMSWMIAMKDAVLKEFDANVVVVDWAGGAMQINYLQVTSNTRVVAAETIRFANFLINNKGASASRFHFVGHSIGAHVAGYVGKAIPNIARITALDAAQPGFEGFPAAVRLATTDAIFVEAIHTNARPFIPTLGFGYMAPIGHVDFYVNGGADQPGCILPTIPPANITSLADLANVTFDVLKKWVFCPHARAFYVFTATVVNKGCIMWGRKANFAQISMSLMSGVVSTPMTNPLPCTKLSCSPLGLQTTVYPGRGVYIVATKLADPWCISEPANNQIMEQFKTAPSATI